MAKCPDCPFAVWEWDVCYRSLYEAVRERFTWSLYKFYHFNLHAIIQPEWMGQCASFLQTQAAAPTARVSSFDVIFGCEVSPWEECEHQTESPLPSLQTVISLNTVQIPASSVMSKKTSPFMNQDWYGSPRNWQRIYTLISPRTRQLPLHVVQQQSKLSVELGTRTFQRCGRASRPQYPVFAGAGSFSWLSSALKKCISTRRDPENA